MTAYIMDTDFYVLRTYENLLSKLHTKVEATFFTGSYALWEAYQTSKHPDAVFLQKEASGSLSLLAKILESNPNQKIILVTDGGDLSPELLNQQISGFLQKPLTAEALEIQFFALHHPFLARIAKKELKTLKAQAPEAQSARTGETLDATENPKNKKEI